MKVYDSEMDKNFWIGLAILQSSLRRYITNIF